MNLLYLICSSVYVYAGKSGSKIKEIRQTTGCSIQVASEMLPNSTERAVTLSGSAEQITQCIYQICLVMLEVCSTYPEMHLNLNINCTLIVFLIQSPPRGATIPYRPKPQVTGPVILANGQAFTIQGNYAVPTQEVRVQCLQMHLDRLSSVVRRNRNLLSINI